MKCELDCPNEATKQIHNIAEETAGKTITEDGVIAGQPGTGINRYFVCDQHAEERKFEFPYESPVA